MENGNNKYVNQLCAGDQLSVERAANTIHSVSNGYTPEDRCYTDSFTLWVPQMMIAQWYLTEMSSTEGISISSPWLTSKSDRPKHVPIPDGIDQMSKLVKLQFLHKVAAKIVDKLIVDEEMMDASIKTMISSQERKEMMDHMNIDKDGRFPCRFLDCSKSFKYNGKSRQTHELSHDPPVIVDDAPCNVTVHNEAENLQNSFDDVFSYNTALLSEAGGSHSVKYALESLYQLLLINGYLSHDESEVITWNRTVNNHGGAG
ncbi:Hypothetical predicted protein [Paramuricea clavata]|uniref:Uncharacterized protein n=1 Tax=Paramuricea clavata TaxID=317549 RepID=A0A7D9DE23_PARCT|nr:Hypothetical predicted protein [Paramuricea clavata]